MPTLTIVRHAKSSLDFGGLDDWERPLDRRGLSDCSAMRKRLRKRLPVPDLVLTSDAVRALETCRVLVEAFDLDAGAVRHLHDLYLASDETVLALIDRHAGDRGHIAVVGHNPGLTDLYNRLLAGALESLPTFAVARVEIETERWSTAPPGAGRLLDYFTPASP